MTVRPATNEVRRADPPIFAFPSPRPPLGGFTIEMHSSRADSRRLLWLPAKTAGSKVRGRAAPATLQDLTKETPWATRGFLADFSGAIPVASALGAAPGATPPRLLQLTMGGLHDRSKPELSTLLESGTFYFALTGGIKTCQGKVEMSYSRQSRNVRFPGSAENPMIVWARR